MISNLWIDWRKNNWNRLEALLRSVESTGVKSLDRSEVREFGLLYRQTAADLSAVRADRTSRMLEQYLNRLVGRAHNYVYVGQRLSPASVVRFFAFGYPRLFRRLSAYVLISTLLSLLAAAVGVVVCIVRPEFGTEYFVQHLGYAALNNLDKHHMWTENILGMEAPISSFIMVNNIYVCFRTFAGGATLGWLTLYSLYNNGLMLGVVAFVCAQHHMSLPLWSFIVSHGSLELPSIFISGAAGLRLAAAILFPGSLTRKDALARGGIEAVQLLSAIIPLLLIAGSLEGFLSPSSAPVALKFATGGMLFTALCLWLGFGGRTAVISE